MKKFHDIKIRITPVFCQIKIRKFQVFAMKLILATHNADKVNELTGNLKGLRITLLSLKDYPEINEIPEKSFCKVGGGTFYSVPKK